MNKEVVMERPLVVVSNRLPYNLPRGSRPPKRNVGGLVNALEPVLIAHGGSWVGWDGALLPSTAAVEAALSRPLVFRTRSELSLHGVPLSEREVGLYYHGFSNRALWPLFHDFPEKAVFAPEAYAAYERVNRRFAQTTLERGGPGAHVWVHDFHLMLVPHFLRELGFKGQIDFFLHVPFPPPEIFRVVPWRKALLRGLLAADSVGFHIPRYRDNFVRSARELVGARDGGTGPRGGELLCHERGETSALAVPIGIDVDDFERIARSPSVAARTLKIRNAHEGCRILLGVDRLDYTKGIEQRLHGLEHFLSTMGPRAAGGVVLIQIVVPSRHQVEEYRTMKREIDREVGRINGEYGRDAWMPIHYQYQALEREELVAHYCAADVMLVTSLRDGMNLVASEYAASRWDERGVLVVSEFAGVSERSPGAILVNPHDVEGCAAAIAQALNMDSSERRDRMALLRARVRSNPAVRWAARCLGHSVALLPASPIASAPPPRVRPESALGAA
jgi:trehalose 6-phosphate synthase